jgi:hypothetical protein
MSRRTAFGWCAISATELGGEPLCDPKRTQGGEDGTLYLTLAKVKKGLTEFFAPAEVVDNPIGIQFPSRTRSDISLIYIKHELIEPPTLALGAVAVGAGIIAESHRIDGTPTSGECPMIRYGLIGFAAAVLVAASLVPDDALARRGGGGGYRGGGGVHGGGMRAANVRGGGYGVAGRGYGYRPIPGRPVARTAVRRGVYRGAAYGAAAGAAAYGAYGYYNNNSCYDSYGNYVCSSQY